LIRVNGTDPARTQTCIDRMTLAIQQGAAMYQKIIVPFDGSAASEQGLVRAHLQTPSGA
jgi:hypothetical protein